jgi:hypothetical protein
MVDVVCYPTVIGVEAAEADPTIPIGWTQDPNPFQMIPEGWVEVLNPAVFYDPTCNSSTIISEVDMPDPHVTTDAGIASIGSGAVMKWSDPGTWAGGAVPIDGNAVAINAADTVVLDIDMSGYVTGLNGLVIHGTLQFATASPISGTALVPSSLTPSIAMKDSTQITGEGTLLVGNSTLDTIAAAPLGTDHRVLITCLGQVPPGGLISVNTCSFYGWYDLVNSTTLAQPQNAGDTTITLVDSLMVNAGDLVVIGAQQTQGAFEGAAMGRYTIVSYNSVTHVALISPPLGSDRLEGDPVAHLSRPIKVVTAQTANNPDVPLFETTMGPFDVLQGAWIQGGIHIVDTISEDLAVTGITLEGNYMPALYNNSGDLFLDKSTFLNGATDVTHGAMLDAMTGTTFIQDCTILGAEVGLSNIAGAQARRVTIQNMSTECLNTMSASLFNSCNFQGSSLGAYNGGHNTYINCTFTNNINDFDSEYEASCYRLILGNPLSLGLPVGSTQKLWYANRSYDHGQVQSEHRVWCVGGYGYLQDLEEYAGLPTWQFVVERENAPVYWDTPFLAVEGQQVSISVAMKKIFSGGDAKFQIIDPALDPLYGFGDSAITETELPDEIDHWNILPLTFIPQATQPYIARVQVQNITADGVAYAQLQGLNAALIVGDQSDLLPPI